ncbi:MAG: two-component sensor histidine kinase [Rhizobiaceae bacterium]|nr:MAG: two-component sensor histidine kinase [Rhizobiaceae bacterium]
MASGMSPRSTLQTVRTERETHSRPLKIPLDVASAAVQRERAIDRLTAIGEMTGGIAHDFRSLLSVIDSGLRLVESSAGDPAKQQPLIGSIRKEIARGVDLASQLLAFAKRQVLDAHTGNPNEFLRSFEPFLRYGAGPDVRVRLMLGSDIPNCMIDPAFFDAAILNLIVNARDAMPGGGEVRVVTDRWEDAKTGTDGDGQVYARVRVEDDGCGMPEKVVKKVFEPFFTTKGESGTGIGLTQVQAFISMVGGRIDVASKSGVGTTVTLFFPAVKPVDASSA